MNNISGKIPFEALSALGLMIALALVLMLLPGCKEEKQQYYFHKE